MNWRGAQEQAEQIKRFRELTPTQDVDRAIAAGPAVPVPGPPVPVAVGPPVPAGPAASGSKRSAEAVRNEEPST